MIPANSAGWNTLLDRYELLRHYGTNAEKFSNISENAISVNFNRDTRNNTVIPTAGSRITLGSRYRVSEERDICHYLTEATYYHQLFWRSNFEDPWERDNVAGNRGQSHTV